MGRILTIILSVYWASALAVAAVGFSAADRFATGVDVPGGWEAAARLTLGAGCALSATLFAWLTVSMVLDRDGVPGPADEVAYTAFAGGALSLTAAMMIDRLFGLEIATNTAPSLAALLASYVVVHVERRSYGRPTEDKLAEIRAAARVVALGTAHDAFVSRLALQAPANDDGVR